MSTIGYNYQAENQENHPVIHDTVQTNHPWPSSSYPWSRIWIIILLSIWGCLKMGYTLQMAIEYGTSCISNHQTKPDLSMKVGYLKIIQNPMVNHNFPSIFPWISLLPAHVWGPGPPGWAALTTASLGRLNSWKPWSNDYHLSFINRITW
jgi:hypothetical protein